MTTLKSTLCVPSKPLPRRTLLRGLGGVALASGKLRLPRRVFAAARP